MSRSAAWLGLGIFALATLALSLDGLYYWHDVRFLYGTTHFSLRTLLGGSFNPHQAWGPIDEVSSAGFYATKILHLAVLQQLFTLVPPDAGGLKAAAAFSVLCMAITAACAGILIRRACSRKHMLWVGIAGFLAVPVTPYLAGKQLAEISSLVLTTSGLLLTWHALRSDNRASWSLGLGAGLVLLAATTARPDSLFGISAFFGAVWWCRPDTTDRAKTAAVAASALAVVAVGYLALARLLGFTWAEYSHYLRNFISAPSRPPLMSVLSILSFGGVAYLAAMMAWLSSDRRAARFFLVWWLAASLPSILLTSAYMVEPRYLAQGLVPLAGLVALGMEEIWRRALAPRLALTALGAGAVLALNAFTIRLMPYEVDGPALLRAVEEIEAIEPDAAILVPWAYTDFMFLYAVRPSAAVYSVHYYPSGEIAEPLAASWHARYRQWFDGRHLSEPEEVLALLQTRPVFYLGWHRYPPLEFVQSLATKVGLKGLTERVSSLGFMDHMETSWVRSWPLVRFEHAGASGQYEYFRVSLAR